MSARKVDWVLNPKTKQGKLTGRKEM